MDFEIYHDESKIEGFWHGMLLVPVARKQQLIDLMAQARKNIRYTHPISLKKVKNTGMIYDLSQSWLSIALASMRTETRGKPVPIYLGEKVRGQKKYEQAGELTGTKFILFRSVENHTDMIGHKDHASKVETTFRMGLKGGLHFLGNVGETINITKIHFDGHEHLQRHIDAQRVVGRITGLRDYCSISQADNVIDDRTSDHRKPNSQSYEDCQLLQLADLMVGSFRTALGHSTKEMHTKLSYPTKSMIDRYSKGFARMENSRWRDSFCMSECHLESGHWVFNTIELEKEGSKSQHLLPGFE